MERMDSERTPKRLLNGELFGVLRRARPRKRWFQDVKDDIRRLKIGKWKEKAQERNAWLVIVKAARAHEGL
jgi:hypothetical protein